LILLYHIHYFVTLFQQEVRDGKNQMTHLTNQWYQEVRAAPSDTEEELETPL
jgi:hypothetical protein